MANSDRGESLGELYARIGLNYDDLENSFVEVERTLQANLSRLSRERNIINLQSRIDLIGLDEATDATRIFEIRQRSLQRQLENQRTRLRLLGDSLTDVQQRTGDNSDETQRAQIAYENARLSVARLEHQLNELNESQNRGTNWTDSIVEFSKKAAPVISVAKTLFDVFNQMQDATQRLIEKFRELQKNAFNFNLPIKDADTFAQKIRLAGGELDDIGGYLRGITDALIKGEVDDPEWIALQRYGETIFDTTGKLKNYADIWETVHRAFKKAKEEGREVEFLQLTGGESGVTDAMQALQQWEQAVEDAGKIVSANLDFKQLKDADRQFKLLAEQTEEFKDALSATFQPQITAAAEKFFAILQAGTKWLVDNRAEIHDALNTPNTFFSNFDYLKAEEANAKKLFANIKKYHTDIGKVFATSEGLEQAHQQLKKRLKETAKKDSDVLMQYSKQRALELKKAIEDLRIEIDYDSDYNKAVATAELERKRALKQIVVGKEERAAIEAKYRADMEKAAKDHKDRLDDIWRETNALVYEIKIKDDPNAAFKKEIYAIEQWKQKALEDLGEFKDAVGDKNKWLQEAAAITSQALAKETQAFENEIDRIEGKTKSLREKIFEQERSQRNNDIYKAQKERAQMLEEGIYPEEWINRWYENELSKIQARAKLDRNYKKSPKLPKVDTSNIPDFYSDIQEEIDYVMAQHKENLKRQLGTVGNLTDLKQQPQQNIHNFQDSVTRQIQDVTQQIQTAFSQPLMDLNAKFGTLTFNLESFDGYISAATIAARDLAIAITSITEETNKKKFSFGDISTKDDKSLASLMQNTGVTVSHMQLDELTRIVGSIAQGINQQKQQQQQPPQITINLTVHNDLGGAYVFDDQMKLKLEDDITTEVAKAVKEAVEQGVSNTGYGYGGR